MRNIFKTIIVAFFIVLGFFAFQAKAQTIDDAATREYLMDIVINLQRQIAILSGRPMVAGLSVVNTSLGTVATTSFGANLASPLVPSLMLPTVKTLPATNITANSAILNGEITSLGSYQLPMDVNFWITKASINGIPQYVHPLIDDGKIFCRDSYDQGFTGWQIEPICPICQDPLCLESAEFSKLVGCLVPNTTYYYWALARPTNLAGSGTGLVNTAPATGISLTGSSNPTGSFYVTPTGQIVWANNMEAFKTLNGTVLPSCNRNYYCEANLGETFASCPTDCRATCNFNKVCEAILGETDLNCPFDCGCNRNNICEAARGENMVNCPTDCKPFCNFNKVCEANLGETALGCPTDCGCNNNYVCEALRGENYTNCAYDCKSPCNRNNVCDTSLGENVTNCPEDCQCNNNGVCDPVKGETAITCPKDCFIPPTQIPTPIKRFTCTNWQCVEDLNGTYNSATECSSACVKPKTPGYNCVNYTCTYVADQAQYTAFTTCSNNCQRPATTTYYCDDSYICRQGAISSRTSYSSLTSCSAACVKPVIKYSCVNNQCVQSTSGIYSDLTTCNANCVVCSTNVTAQWNKYETGIGKDTNECKNISDFADAYIKVNLYAKCGDAYLRDDSIISMAGIQAGPIFLNGAADHPNNAFVYDCSGTKVGNYYKIPSGGFIGCTVRVHIQAGSTGDYAAEIKSISWSTKPDGTPIKITLPEKMETVRVNLVKRYEDWRRVSFTDGFCGLDEGGKCAQDSDCGKYGSYLNICRAKNGGIFRNGIACSDTGSNQRRYCYYSLWYLDPKNPQYDCTCVQGTCKWAKKTNVTTPTQTAKTNQGVTAYPATAVGYGAARISGYASNITATSRYGFILYTKTNGINGTKRYIFMTNNSYGSFAYSLTGLKAGTMYCYQAFVEGIASPEQCFIAQ